MSANDRGVTTPHDDSRIASPNKFRRDLRDEATADLDAELTSYRCRGCSEKCLNGADELTAKAGLCVTCTAYLLVDLGLTGVTDAKKLEAEA